MYALVNDTFEVVENLNEMSRYEMVCISKNLSGQVMRIVFYFISFKMSTLIPMQMLSE